MWPWRFLLSFTQMRSFSFTGYKSEGGIPFKGQGLMKSKPVESEWLKKFVQNRKREQKWGKRYVPIFPDILFYVRTFTVLGSGLLLGWILYPSFADYSASTDDPTLVYDSAVVSSDEKKKFVQAYLKLPLRLLSRSWGHANSFSRVPVWLRPYVFGLYSNMYAVNMDEAENPDYKSYKNLSEFFRRAIKPSVRPIDPVSDVVSPADGKILHYGWVTNGEVEQVKGINYSLQKFLGPLPSEPVHDDWGREDGYSFKWGTVPLKQYMRALMHKPDENNLYHCVIYLAPGDYHRFHSPADWIVEHRRHFPGDLLSVNPRIASLIPNLFVLNERVVLSGKWNHGFFSMTAVGATNVGSIEIYGDVTLKTNRPKRVYGAFYDEKYDSVPATKGMAIGEFNLGSTIVLIFEAPKDFAFDIGGDEKIKYGERLQAISD